MSETGQPGAATPGEHGDGTGQRDDLARSGNGWSASPVDWSWGPEVVPGSDVTGSRSESPSGWATASSRHADLPAPVGEQAEPERPSGSTATTSTATSRTARPSPTSRPVAGTSGQRATPTSPAANRPSVATGRHRGADEDAPPTVGPVSVGPELGQRAQPPVRAAPRRGDATVRAGSRGTAPAVRTPSRRRARSGRAAAHRAPSWALPPSAVRRPTRARPGVPGTRMRRRGQPAPPIRRGRSLGPVGRRSSGVPTVPAAAVPDEPAPAPAPVSRAAGSNHHRDSPARRESGCVRSPRTHPLCARPRRAHAPYAHAGPRPIRSRRPSRPATVRGTAPRRCCRSASPPNRTCPSCRSRQLWSHPPKPRN